MSAIRNRAAAAVVTLGLAAAGVLSPVAPPAQAAGAELYAPMRATSYCPSAHGGAAYDAHSGSREFSIHLRGLGKLAGKRVTVTVHGAFVGRMRVSSYGRAHLDRHRGVPSMAAGNRVRVTRPGHLVSSGRLRSMHHYR